MKPFTVGKLHVDVGNLRVRCGPLWLPDGLHVWWGRRGFHAFWSGDRGPRFQWATAESEGTER